MYARLKNLRVSPRKVRYVADLVRGMSVGRALAMLSQVHKAASRPVAELIKSAIANAIHSDENTDPQALYIARIQVDQGITFKRFTPRARGSATPILKKSSHVIVELGQDT